MISHNFKNFSEFNDALREVDYLGCDGSRITGMHIYYVPEEDPCLHFMFNHKNKRKAWKEFKEFCKVETLDIKPYITLHIMGINYIMINYKRK